MYSLPQEIEVWYIIPSIRKELARLLTERYKLTFERTGNILGISKSAVCQYLKNKRASKISLPSSVKKEIAKSAAVIMKNEKAALKEIIRILALMKKTKCSCGICQKYNKGVLKQCSMMPVKGE